MSLDKYIKPVGCISPRASVTEAAESMKSKGIGAVVVINDDYKPIGLVTDRDVTVRVVAEGKDPDQTKVEEIMSGGIHALPATASIQEVTTTMRDKGVRRIPITDENERVTGLVSLDDILLLLSMELGNLAQAIFSELSRPPEAGVSHSVSPA